MLNSKVQSIMNGNGFDLDDEVGFVLNAKSIKGKKNRKNMKEQMEQREQGRKITQIEKETIEVEDNFTIYNTGEACFYEDEEEESSDVQCDVEEDFSIYEVTEESFYGVNKQGVKKLVEQGEHNTEVQKELMGMEEDFSIYDISEEDYYNEESELVVEQSDVEEDFSIYDMSEQNFYVENEEETKEEFFDKTTNCISEDIHTFSKIEKLKTVEYEQDQKTKAKLEHKDKLPYFIAKRVLREYKLLYFDSPVQCDQLSVFDKTHWRILKDDEVQLYVYRILTKEEKMGVDNIKSLCKNVCNFIKMECMNGYFQKKKGKFFSFADFEKVKFSVVFSNGIYDAKTDEFRTDIDASTLPYLHAVDAKFIENPQKIKTPNMNKLLYDASHDVDTLKLAYEMIGYIAIPSTTGKALLVFAGVGDSGKSVLGAFCESIFKDKTTFRIQPDQLGNRFALANAGQATLLTCLDVPTRRLTIKETGMLKRLSGEQALDSEAKFQNVKTVPIRFKVLLATNGSLKCSEKEFDEAYYRRVVILPFLYKKKKEEIWADLPMKLEAEKDSIITKAVKSIHDCISESGAINFHVSDLSAEIKQSWMFEKADLDLEFINDAFMVTGNMEDLVNKQDIQYLYKIYCEENGDSTDIISDATTLNRKIAKSASVIKMGKDVKSRAALHKRFKNPVPCLRGLKWRQEFLEKYDSEDEPEYA